MRWIREVPAAVLCIIETVLHMQGKTKVGRDRLYDNLHHPNEA